jgi:hypothetical protein
MFLKSSCQGLFNGILHFEFGKKLYELCSNEGFKSGYFILLINTFQMAFKVLALGTKGKYHFDFEFPLAP